MPLSVDGHVVMLNALKNAATWVSLSKALLIVTIQGTAGATTGTLSRAVKVGDYLSFNNGTNREVVKVTANPGTTPTWTPALANVYQTNHDVGHAPKLVADLVEPTGGTPPYARKAITWVTPTIENLTINPAALPTFDVAGGNKIGGFGIHTAQTGTAAGTFLGSFLTANIDAFGAQGTYQLTDADVNLVS